MPVITENAVLQALSQVLDPELNHNVVELGFIQEVEIIGDHVHLEIQLTTPHCPFAEKIVTNIRTAVAKVPGVRSVDVERACTQED